MTDERLSPYEQAHLIVAAIRLFFHREGKLPSAGEIASQVEMPVEVVYLLCNQLIEEGIIGVVGGAFDQRFEVKEHLKIEELPRSVDEGAMEREIEAYRAERKGKQKKIEEMFEKKEFEKRRREQMKKIEEQFKAQGRKKRPNPFDTGEA